MARFGLGCALNEMRAGGRWANTRRGGNLVTDDDVYFAYRLLLGRFPDDSGMQTYRDEFVGKRDTSDLVEEFLLSPEFRRRRLLLPRLRDQAEETGAKIIVQPTADAKDPSYNPLTTAEDVFYAYRLILGRHPDEDGWRNFSGLVGVAPVCDMVAPILSSEEFGKTEVAADGGPATLAVGSNGCRSVSLDFTCHQTIP